MTNQNTAAQPMLTDDEIMRAAINASGSLNITRVHEIGGPSRTIMDDAGLLELGRAIETAVLSKLRAPVADEQDRTAMSQFLTDVMTAAGLVAHGKQCKALADRLGKACMDLRLSALLASAPVADAQPVAYLHTSNRTLTWPGKLNEVQLASGVWRALYEHPPAPGHKPAPMDVSPGHSSPVAGEAQPVAWVAADTLNSPHPTCISSLAYMSQIDRDRGREYVPLYAAPVAAQTADDARDAERWREVERRARKNTAYDRYGHGAHWSVGVFSDDSRQTFGETIDAAINSQRKEGGEG